MDFEYLKNKRLLLVDDQQELLDMVVSILKEEGFHYIATAKTVKEVLFLADSFQPEKEGESMALKAKEHDILAALHRNAGRIITIHCLCQAAWGENPFGYENSLMGHIKRIRENVGR